MAFAPCYCAMRHTPRSRTVLVAGGPGCGALTAAAATRRGARVLRTAAACVDDVVDAAVFAVGAGDTREERARWEEAVAQFRALPCNKGFFVVRTLLCPDVVHMLNESGDATWAVLRPGALGRGTADGWRGRAVLTTDVRVNGRVARELVAEVLAELCVDEGRAEKILAERKVVGLYDGERLIMRPAGMKCVVSF